MEMKRKFRGWDPEPSLLVHVCHLQSPAVTFLSHWVPIFFHISAPYFSTDLSSVVIFFSVNRVTYPHKHLERQGLKDIAAKSWGCTDTLHPTEVKAG